MPTLTDTINIQNATPRYFCGLVTTMRRLTNRRVNQKKTTTNATCRMPIVMASLDRHP